MWAIWRREWNGFLNSLVAYIAMVVFLLITGLFIWVFPDYSILEFGYAQLDQLFVIGPWVLMFLVPAVTMRFFSEEKRSGTAELLFTRPVSTSGVVLGKFLAGWALVLFSVLPTLCYVVALYYLAEPVGNLDLGGIAGSYLGLVLLGGLAIFPFWLLHDLALKKNSFHVFYASVEKTIRQKHVAWPLIVLILLNWCWNIYKGV